MKNKLDGTEFNTFVIDIKQKILSKQYEALKSVNKELISLYWDIGKSIVEKQESLGRGKSVTKLLSKELQNLWIMRQFYLEYSENEKLQTLVGEIAKFKPEFAGKMSFYLSVLNDTVKLPDENPSIGIIICQEKNRTTVEYALKENTRPMGVATYKLTDSLPTSLKGLLPSSQDIEEKVINFFDKYKG